MEVDDKSDLMSDSNLDDGHAPLVISGPAALKSFANNRFHTQTSVWDTYYARAHLQPRQPRFASDKLQGNREHPSSSSSTASTPASGVATAGGAAGAAPRNHRLQRLRWPSLIDTRVLPPRVQVAPDKLTATYTGALKRGAVAMGENVPLFRSLVRSFYSLACLLVV